MHNHDDGWDSFCIYAKNVYKNKRTSKGLNEKTLHNYHMSWKGFKKYLVDEYNGNESDVTIWDVASVFKTMKYLEKGIPMEKKQWKIQTANLFLILLEYIDHVTYSKCEPPYPLEDDISYKSILQFKEKLFSNDQ